jgi:hypothetical protein
MRLFLDRGHNLHESPHVVGGDAAAGGVFEIREVAVDALRNLLALGRQRDHEGAAIGGADLACDQRAGDEAIENARQRRPLMREAAVQLRDRRRR